MKVPIPADETFIPMEVSDIEALQEQRKKRDRYWAMLRSARIEYFKLMEQAAPEYDADEGAFFYYIKENYGLQVELIDGKIAGEYAVVDEKKYLMFLIKFG